MKNETLTKGPMLEEALRAYFLKAGYFAIRGVPFVFEKFDVTDIDIWLYGRSSSVSREIAIVDIKNKRTPQAIERIFWTKGLQTAVGANRSIVATTDKRPEVKDFGRKLDVLVLDGVFLNKMSSKLAHLETRLTDEELISLISSYDLAKIDGDWKGRFTYCKGLLSQGLSFDVCNNLLANGHFFAEQAITKEAHSQIALRCLYIICAYLSICIDYELRDISFIPSSERSQIIAEGFTYGSKGRSGLKNLVDLSTDLVAAYANDGRAIANQVKAKIEKSLHNIPSSVLGDYFSRGEVQTSLFAVAKEFEELAMARSFKSHTRASIDLRSLLGCLMDYWGLDRMHLALASNEAPIGIQSDLLKS